MLSHGGIDPGPGLLVIAQVHGRRAIQGEPLGLHQGCRLFVAFGVEVAADHDRPFAGKTQCRSAALASAGPGNQRDFVV
ncbi:hypothetical protein D3C84_1215610 [compost metagenome]